VKPALLGRIGLAVGLASCASAGGTRGAPGAALNPAEVIGVHSEVALDASRRSAASGAARVIQITVWYPARRAAESPITFGEYFDLAADERRLAADSTRETARAGYTSFLLSRGMGERAVTAWFSTAMLAFRDAAPAGGRHTLVVIVQGNGESAVDECTLAETLARHGYIVATSPSYSRLSHPPTTEADLGTGAEEQADDIAFVIARVRCRGDVDSSRLGIVAHSLGARGALLYCMRGAGVRAFVSLDGGIGTATGRAAMEAAPSFASRRLPTPTLHLYETLDAFMTPDFTLLRELKGAEIFLARASELHHQHFTSLGAWSATVPGLGHATGALERTASAHATMELLTLGFLDEHVMGTRGAFQRARAREVAREPGVPTFLGERLDGRENAPRRSQRRRLPRPQPFAAP
jgi:dienelactone hydrolase